MTNLSKKFEVYVNTLRQKGNLAYEYNPFYNYLTAEDLYLVRDKYIIPAGKAVNIKNGEILNKKNGKWIDKRNKIIPNAEILTTENGTIWAKAGSLVDLDTDQLNFDLDHPVDIEVLPSYDGSVNLILNDDKNIPRLINSRFSVREKDTYEIVDRIGENDTNIYNSKTFDKDTSLYFLYESNPLITYLGFVKGTLQVGQYCFYFTYCDADDNESDFIAESGLIPVFIGNDLDPRSMDGGIKNQIANKGIQLKLSNLDKSYNYLKVYYVRYFADYQLNRVWECKKLTKKIPVNSSILYLQITGYEETEDTDANILNISRFNPNSVLTLAQCKNMLFFGNIVKNTDNYKELTDIALRITPQLNVIKNFDTLNELYLANLGDGAYYNSQNIYNKTGYFNLEFYRFGVVFIYENGSLSNVYNILGGDLDIDNPLKLLNPLVQNEDAKLYNTSGVFLTRNYIKIDDNGWVKRDDSTYVLKGTNVNAKGVCRFNYKENYDDSTIFSVKFRVPGELSKYLREDLKIRGLFFVRQKCIPNIIALCYLLNMDETTETPILEEGIGGSKQHYTECFIGNDRLIKHDYNARLYKYTHMEDGDNAISALAFAGICPDFVLNLPYYNLIFNGGKFKLQKISVQNSELSRNDRFYNEKPGTIYNISEGVKKVNICSVTENVDTIAIQKRVYRLKVGQAEEAYRFKYAEVDNGVYSAGDEDFDEIDKQTNLVRGVFSPYLAIYSNSGELETGCLYNIYLDSPINTTQEFETRMNSSEPFYAISDRYNTSDDTLEYVCWRGDCYINQYTHRMSRNFNDPSLPNNDNIIDMNTWANYYKSSNPDKWKNISRSDINAVQIGSWITFKCRSSMNYALRSVDHSYVSEESLMGSARSFFPRSYLLQRGENKMPDSCLFNDAYRASLGFKCYFTLQDMNYIKDTFSNRILYSAMAIQDSFKNNYRLSLSTYFRDYSQEYGSILKLVGGFEGYILVIFEHGIGIATINERILAGLGDGEPVFINTQNVLPEELTIITDTYGTQWPESVVKSEAGYVYGVDTSSKKIWRVKGNQLEILSDFKVNKFLIDNISLGERELYPTIGLRNVKTHYNNNKKDVMFTFYDDVHLDEEKAWNLCYNELLGSFITFYSWIPSYSANIDTKFFTFDRDTSKWLSLLSKCNYAIPENTGVLVDVPVINDKSSSGELISGNLPLPNIYYATKEKYYNVTYTVINSDGTSSTKTVTEESRDNGNGLYIVPLVNFTLEKDHWGNYKLFNIYGNQLRSNVTTQVLREKFEQLKVILLYVTPTIVTVGNVVADTSASSNMSTEVIALTLSSIVENPLLTSDEKLRLGLTTDFYLHGQAGIFNVAENLYPTYWYGKYHPFEFEFVVNDKIAQLKIFSDLVIISNKAEPESFHFEIEGDNYDFSSDKRTMYFRQESTKELFLNMGSDMLFDRYYTDVMADKYTQEQYYRGNPKKVDNSYVTDSTIYTDLYNKFDRVYPVASQSLVLSLKSTIFPLYYERIDTYNDIYHIYRGMLDGVQTNYDFKNLSGSEIKWYRDLNQFNVITHIKNSPIDLVGRLRGNSRYKEGKWHVQIPSITFNLKNEEDWAITYAKNRFRVDHSDLDSNDILGHDWEDYLPGDGELVLPPIIINSTNIPSDLSTSLVSDDIVPNIYTNYGYAGVKVDSWTYRKETRIRDKWIKIRIRYSGKNLAVIHSLVTLYNISYS